MKTKAIAHGGIAVLAAVSFALTACGGKKEEKDSGGDKPKEGDKPAAPAGDPIHQIADLFVGICGPAAIMNWNRCRC